MDIISTWNSHYLWSWDIGSFTLLYLYLGHFSLFFSINSAHYGGKWWFLCSHMTVRLIEQPLCSWAHDQECHHVIVSLITWQSVSLFILPFTLLVMHSCLLHYYSALPLTFILTPWHTLSFSFMLTELLYVCPTLHYPILYFLTAVSLYL